MEGSIVDKKKCTTDDSRFCVRFGRKSDTKAGDSGTGFFVNVGGTFYLKGSLGSSVSDSASDVKMYTKFIDVYHFKVFIEDSTNRKLFSGELK